jgi:hypothetical protein
MRSRLAKKAGITLVPGGFRNQQTALAKYLFCQVTVIGRDYTAQIDKYRYGMAMVIKGGAVCDGINAES